MSVLTAPAARPDSPACPPGPPKLPAAELRRAQSETLRTPRFDYSIPARLLFWMVDLIYGRQRSLRKFVVLEIVARVPYQAWERAAYGALTRVHPRLRLAGRIFDRVVETRAQQDNEQFHLLILEELAQRQGLRPSPGARPVPRGVPPVWSADVVPEVRTARLVLRGWRPEDRSPYAALNVDPVVGEYLGGPLAPAASDAMVDGHEEHWAQEGFGIWAVEVPDVAPLVGSVGLRRVPGALAGAPAVEVAWRPRTTRGGTAT